MEIEPVSDEEDDDSNLLTESPRFQALLNRSRHSIRETGGLAGDEIWNGLDDDEGSTATN